MPRTPFALETVMLDLPALVGAFGRRLHEAGVPVTAERSARFAQALTIVKPVARRRLYWTARAVFVSERAQIKIFDAVFTEVFGAGSTVRSAAPEATRQVPSPPEDESVSERSAVGDEEPADEWSAGSAPAPDRHGEGPPEHAVAVPTVASYEELIRDRRFDALAPDELEIGRAHV